MGSNPAGSAKQKKPANKPYSVFIGLFAGF
nr:MAG TPA: hypothetical protein [Caudoviricetes sp.]